MRNKKIFASMAMAVAVFASVAAFAASHTSGIAVRAGECSHEVVNHYDRVEPTPTKAGSIEYWVCCECHQSFSDEALTTVIENTISSVGHNFLPTDGRYLAPTHTAGENIHVNSGFDTINDVYMRLDRTAAWNLYPYGNWSDMNGDVGGHYYIETDDTGNSYVKAPAVVWAPGNTTVKKDVGAASAAPGTYEISFDLKASKTALTANNNGNYGKLAIYMWANAAFNATITGGSSAVNVLANEETWTNVRARYTIPEEYVCDYNQINIIYWPEGTIGEDNYVCFDNFAVYKVVDGVADTTNIDSCGEGDLEKFNTRRMNVPGHWYHDGTILIENESVGSELVTEGDNHYFKMVSGNRTADSRVTLKSSATLNTAGLYHLTVDVKLGADADVNTPLKVIVWSFINGGVNAVCPEVVLTPTDTPSKDNFVTYESVLTSVGATNDWANLFLIAGLGNDVNTSTDNCLYLDNINVYPLTAK